MFSVETIGGAEWAVAGQGGLHDVRYVYLAPAGAAPLSFHYVDLSRVLRPPSPGWGWGLTAVATVQGVIYLGFSGYIPQLVGLRVLPDAPGLDANQGTDADGLSLDSMPGVGGNGSPRNFAFIKLVDALAAFGGRLYVANSGGLVRSTVALPRAYDAYPGDWAACTPSAPAYAAKVSISTPMAYDAGVNVEPSGRAFPALAEWKGRLFTIRNTYTGPQLWACSPTSPSDIGQCDPGDWLLASPNNPSGDAQASQMNDAGNTHATLLVATASWLYVGFENAATGVQIFRTAAAAPMSSTDFHGEGGCEAGAVGCQGLGGDGLGDPARNTHIFDARALAPSGRVGLYFTAGNGTDPVRVYQILD